jgi:hypothetical protein
MSAVTEFQRLPGMYYLGESCFHGCGFCGRDWALAEHDKFEHKRSCPFCGQEPRPRYGITHLAGCPRLSGTHSYEFEGTPAELVYVMRKPVRRQVSPAPVPQWHPAWQALMGAHPR